MITCVRAIQKEAETANSLLTESWAQDASTTILHACRWECSVFPWHGSSHQLQLQLGAPGLLQKLRCCTHVPTDTNRLLCVSPACNPHRALGVCTPEHAPHHPPTRRPPRHPSISNSSRQQPTGPTSSGYRAPSDVLSVLRGPSCCRCCWFEHTGQLACGAACVWACAVCRQWHHAGGGEWPALIEQAVPQIQMSLLLRH